MTAADPNKDSGQFWSAVTALATVGLVIVGLLAWFVPKALSDASQGDPGSDPGGGSATTVSDGSTITTTKGQNSSTTTTTVPPRVETKTIGAANSAEFFEGEFKVSIPDEYVFDYSNKMAVLVGSYGCTEFVVQVLQPVRVDVAGIRYTAIPTKSDMNADTVTVEARREALDEPVAESFCGRP